MYTPVYTLMNSDMFMAILMENSPEKPETKKTKRFLSFADITQTSHSDSTPYLHIPELLPAAEPCGGNKETWHGPDLSSSAPSGQTAEV